jgi:tRNA pseudouridine38-40 synthase
MRIKLVVAYDGTDFRGWAPQAGHRTVQATLREGIRLVSGEDVELLGASRTDSGAHARGQVCHFDVQVGIHPEKWSRVLNRVLPPDLRVIASEQVSDAFHSRFSADSRHYRYRFLIGQGDPFRTRYTFEHWQPLDMERMQEGGRALVGEHDFRAFTEELDPSIENTRRTLFSVDVSRSEDEIWLDVVGTAFLRGMMRRMAGALFEIGRGGREVETISGLLEPDVRDDLQWPVVLPARGLTLMEVRYATPKGPGPSAILTRRPNQSR